MTKLTKYDVIDINRKSAMGMDTSEIASNYGVTTATIRKIENGQSWKNVESPKLIREYPSYEITTNGKIYNKGTGKYMTVNNGSVRLRDNDGFRERVQVSDLMGIYYH